MPKKKPILKQLTKAKIEKKDLGGKVNKEGKPI